MSSPLVRSIRPGDGETSSIFGEYTISVADAESRVSLYKTQIISLLAREKYTSGIPDKIFHTKFDDTGANPNTGNRADFSAGSFGIRLNSDGGSHTDGCILIPSAINSSIVGASFTVSLVPSTSKTVPYTSSSDYVGMAVALVLWDLRSEVLLMFEDDGVSKSVTVVGPSIDGVGTRAFTSTTAYDWSTTSTFTIAIDTERDKLYVTAHKSETDEDTVLVRTSFSSIGSILNSLQFGSLDTETASGMHLVLVNDGATIGDEIELSAYTLFSDGYPLVKNGLFTSNVEDTFATTSDSFISLNTIDGWEYTTSSIGNLNQFLTINSVQGALGATIKYPSLTLKNGEVMFAVDFSTKYNTYTGVSSNAGIDIAVGSKIVQIRALSSLGQSYLGIQTGSAASLLSNYTVGATDIATPTRYIFTVCVSRDTVDIHAYNEATERYVLLCQETLSSLPTANSQNEYYVEVGVFGAHEGTVFLKNIFVLPESKWLVPADIQNISPPVDSVNGFNSAFTTSAITHTTTTHPIEASYSIQSDTSANTVQGGFVKLHKYKPSESGITIGIIFDKPFTDGLWSPKAEYGPFISINSGDRFGGSSEETLSVQLSFIKAMDGRIYGFIGKDDNDSQEVYARTAVGRNISFEANKQAYMVSYKPYDGIYIREYFLAEPLLYVSWVDTSGSERVHQTDLPEFYFVPTNISTDSHFTYCLMGGILNSMPSSRQSTLSGVFHSIGRGVTYRFYFNRDLPLADYSANLFRLIVDVEDDD